MTKHAWLLWPGHHCVTLLSPQCDLIYNVGGAVDTLMQTGTLCALVLLVNVT